MSRMFAQLFLGMRGWKGQMQVTCSVRVSCQLVIILHARTVT